MAEARVKTIFFWTCTTFKNNYCIGVGHVWGRRNCGCAQDSRLCMCNIVQTSPCCSAGSCRRNETSPYEGTASASRHVTARHGTAQRYYKLGTARHGTPQTAHARNTGATEDSAASRRHGRPRLRTQYFLFTIHFSLCGILVSTLANELVLS